MKMCLAGMAVERSRCRNRKNVIERINSRSIVLHSHAFPTMVVEAHMP